MAWINHYVRSCDECQDNKGPRHARCGLLQPVQMPFPAWTSISTDFITHLPESEGHTQIMVVVDRLTKRAHVIGLNENATAKDVDIAFLRKVWQLHCLPSQIISDMDAIFSGEFWESLCQLLGIKQKCLLHITPKQMARRRGSTKRGTIPTQICKLQPERWVSAISTSRTPVQ